MGGAVVELVQATKRYGAIEALAGLDFAVGDGEVVAVLGPWRFTRRWPQQEQAVLWTNADGSTLLVLAHRPGVTLSPTSPSPGVGFPVQFGVLHGNRYTPLPGQPRLGRLSIFPAW